MCSTLLSVSPRITQVAVIQDKAPSGTTKAIMIMIVTGTSVTVCTTGSVRVVTVDCKVKSRQSTLILAQ